MSSADEERGTVPLSGKVTEDSVTALITAEKLPPTIEFNDQNSQKIFGAGIQKQLLLIAKGDDLKSDSPIFKAFRGLSKTHKGKLVLVTVNVDGTAKDPVLNFFSVKEDEAPVVVGFEMTGNKKFRMPGDVK